MPLCDVVAPSQPFLICATYHCGVGKGKRGVPGTIAGPSTSWNPNMNNVKKDWWLSFNVFGEVWGVPLRELARMSAGDSLPDGVPTKGEIESELRRFAERESEALRYALAQPWSRVKPYARKLRDHIVVGNAEVGAAWALMRGAQVCVFEREDSTARVVCSQCGGEYPHASPIAQGYSHCEDHQVTA